ncbi:MAG: sensor histidine kinase, partial [Nocardioides sp.]
LSLYRITQESLANVRRHSTARAARVVVRLGRHDGFDERASDGAGNDHKGRYPGGMYAEVEITDNGRPRNQLGNQLGGRLPEYSSTSGSGLGQLGIRERAAMHGGLVDIGPRVTGGYRVRVRVPVAQAVALSPERVSAR